MQDALYQSLLWARRCVVRQLRFRTPSPHSTSADGVYIESSASFSAAGRTCLHLHLSSSSVDSLQGGLSVLDSYHPVLIVYRAACLCLHVITHCGWFTGWRVCVCICHHPVRMVYGVACLCLHLSSPSVDGLQGGLSVLACHHPV